MHKSTVTVIASLLILSGLAAAPVAMADPSVVLIEFTCPSTTSTDLTALVNYGSFIGGYGAETINTSPSTPNTPFFTFTIPAGANIPAQLSTGSYTNSTTSFDSTANTVSCAYVSSASFDPFTVSYALTNVNVEGVTNSTANTITLTQLMGLRKS